MVGGEGNRGEKTNSLVQEIHSFEEAENKYVK